MRNLLNPKCLLLVNTLPSVLLFMLFYGQYQIIHSLLDEEHIKLWKIFSVVFTFFSLSHLVFALFFIAKNKTVPAYYGLVALLAYVPYLYCYMRYAHEMIPWSIPTWMLPENVGLQVSTFLMPTIMYALLVLVIHLTDIAKAQKAWHNFLLALGVPFGWYLWFTLLMPTLRGNFEGFNEQLYIILFITSTVLFLFFLLRAIYILVINKSAFWTSNQLLWKIPIALVFPLLGLALNNGFIQGGVGENIFGNFKNYWFYILAILNGIFVCLPNLEQPIYRIALFIARSITFAYTFYFFLVFLPYLPLSIIAVFALGFGFLMLTPLLLIVVHSKMLLDDFRFLKKDFSNAFLLSIMTLGALLIPSLIVVSYLQDRHQLHESLDYLYSPDYTRDYVINKRSLNATLQQIKNHKQSNNSFMGRSDTPYLSSLFA